MFNISKNGIITMNRGDSVKFPLFVNIGNEMDKLRYIIKDDEKIYFGVMEANANYVWKKCGDDWCLVVKGKEPKEDGNNLVELSRMNKYFPWTIYVKGKEKKNLDLPSDNINDIKKYIIDNIDKILGKKLKEAKVDYVKKDTYGKYGTEVTIYSCEGDENTKKGFTATVNGKSLEADTLEELEKQIINVVNSEDKKADNMILNDSLKESKEGIMIYQFPELNDEDINKLNDYNLILEARVIQSDDYNTEGDCIVSGTFDSLKRYASDYLAYELVGDYLYDYNDFDFEDLIEQNKIELEESKISEGLNGQVELHTLPEEQQKEFEQSMSDNGWMLDDETSRYGSKNFYKSLWADNDDEGQDIHYQFITKDKYNQEQFDELIDNIFDLLDECEKEFNTRIRFSAGLINDGSEYNGRGTIGIDIDAPELVVKGEDKVPAELAGHKVKLRGGKPIDDASKKVIKDIEDHGFDVSQMGIKKDK